VAYPASGTPGSDCGARDAAEAGVVRFAEVRERVVARGVAVRPAAERGFAADRAGLELALAAERDAVDSAAAPDPGFDRADARGAGWPPAVALALGFAAARERARAGVSVGASAAGGDAAGVARLVLRRAGRVRGRLVSTSRSLPLPEDSLGGMARFLPIRSRSVARDPKRSGVVAVSGGAAVATVACTRRPLPRRTSAIS
jgi:hypothetical protein